MSVPIKPTTIRTNIVLCVLCCLRILSGTVALQSVFLLVRASFKVEATIYADPLWVLPGVCSLFDSFWQLSVIRKDPVPDIIVCAKG